jgi:hypothetical protein
MYSNKQCENLDKELAIYSLGKLRLRYKQKIKVVFKLIAELIKSLKSCLYSSNL